MSAFRERLGRAARFLAYPAFYLLALALATYVTFPYDRLKERLIAEYHASQKPGKGSGARLEIDSLAPSWFTGVEVRGLRLVYPADDKSKADKPDDAKADDAKPELTVSIERVSARLKLLPLLLLRARISLEVEAFGGTLTGDVPIGTSSGPVDLTLSGIELANVGLIEKELGLPLSGQLSGTIQLAPTANNFAKAEGSVALAVSDLGAGRKGKIFVPLPGGKELEFPAVKAGDLTFAATAAAGVLTIDTFSAAGRDVELAGDGKITVREPANDSVLDVLLRFKFTDAYRTSNDVMKSLLGAPGQKNPPPLIESQVPKMKRAKRTDGFYGWHVTGALKALQFAPSTSDSAAAAPKAPAKSKADSPFPKDGTKDKKKPKRSAPSRGRPASDPGSGDEAPPVEAPPAEAPPAEAPPVEAPPVEAPPEASAEGAPPEQ